MRKKMMRGKLKLKTFVVSFGKKINKFMPIKIGTNVYALIRVSEIVSNKMRVKDKANFKKWLIKLGTLILFSTANNAYSNSFDAAVNQFLEGFEYCTLAKEHITEGKLTAAKNALDRYQEFKNAAKKLDNSILSSNKRGMASNLKYCDRVEAELEIALSLPVLEQAFSTCESARLALSENNIENAEGHYQQFLQLKSEALAIAPSINNVYSAKSKISRCDRLGRKIDLSKQQHNKMQVLLDDFNAEAVSYQSNCVATQGILKRDRLSLKQLARAKAGLNETVAAKDAVRELEQEIINLGGAIDKKALAALAEADACFVKLDNQYAASVNDMAAMDASLSEITKQLQSVKKQCESVLKVSARKVDSIQYKNTKSAHEKFVRTRDKTQQRMESLSQKMDLEGVKAVGTIDREMAELNRCLEKSSNHIGILYSAITQPVVQVQKSAPIKTITTNATSIPKTVTGKIKLHTTKPEIAVMYLIGDRPVDQNDAIVIGPAGFNQKQYFLDVSKPLNIVSRDFAFHRISVSIPEKNYSNNITWLKSKQKKSIEVDWPEHTIAQIRSDRASIVPAYILNIPAKQHQLLTFDDEGATAFSLDNGGNSTIGYLLMWGYQPVKFYLNRSANQTIDITKEATKVGELILEGR